MRPKIKFLSNELIEKIISEAFIILKEIGIEINNPKIIEMLTSVGAEYDKNKNRVYFKQELVERAIQSTPKSFCFFDSLGEKTHIFEKDNFYFTPGSAALNILEGETQKIRKPNTQDYIEYVKVVEQLNYISSQSTAFIPADVHEKISDSYRLFLSLLYSKKPIVTGAFTIEAFEIMKDLLLIVRDDEKTLKEKPLAIFSCCPTSPLKWSYVTSQNLFDCAKYSIPVEFISMPLSGFIAPVSLVGSLIQHTAETLSGVVISQVVNPGTPILYGGSPAIFDIRYETTPMGAIETMMIDCAYNEIGKYFGFPTQAYISLSDSKMLDAQAGIESSMGAMLAALSGINNISGPGMLDFESCQSIEKLILDNEICGMTYRLTKGIEPKEDFPSKSIFEELLLDGHLLIAEHTRKFLKEEISFPGKIIDRANHSRWLEEGGLTLLQRAINIKKELLSKYQPYGLEENKSNELIKLMSKSSEFYGQKLPMDDY